jgi:hypothetical protein
VKGRQSFEWDPLFDAPSEMWFAALRDVGWYQDAMVPGVRTPAGTVLFTFHYLGGEDPVAQGS